jgi:phosphoribosyl-ATP pyrophosphohydrolase
LEGRVPSGRPSKNLVTAHRDGEAVAVSGNKRSFLDAQVDGRGYLMLDELFAIIEDRKAHPVEGSYTNLLLSEGEDTIVKKIGEEAIEVIVAAKAQGDQRVIEETADLFYHTLVLLSARGLRLADVEDELRRRHRGDAMTR